MKSEFFDFIENARKPRGARFRQQLFIFLVCLVLSSFIWILVRLSNDYIYTVNYHLIYTHTPEGYRFTGVSDTTVKVNLKIQGFEFFTDQYFKSKRRFHEVNLQHSKLKFFDNHTSAYLLTSTLIREISAENNFPIEIYSIAPDTLFFSFERKGLKRPPLIKINSLPATKVLVTNDSIKPKMDSANIPKSSPGKSSGKKR